MAADLRTGGLSAQLQSRLIKEEKSHLSVACLAPVSPM
jgi:hypothetical protein